MHRRMVVCVVVAALAGVAAAQNSVSPSRGLRTYRTLAVRSTSTLLPQGMMEATLGERADFRELDIALSDDPARADATLHVAHVKATFYYTYKLVHRSGVVLASGRVTSWDGYTAADDIAKHLAKNTREARLRAPRRYDGEDPDEQAKHSQRGEGRFIDLTARQLRELAVGNSQQVKVSEKPERG